MSNFFSYELNHFVDVACLALYFSQSEFYSGVDVANSTIELLQMPSYR